jgi:general secretion pathway protein C
VDRLLRRYFFAGILFLVAISALMNAQAIAQLVGVSLQPDEKELTSSFARGAPAPKSTATARAVSAAPILARNAFDHVTGPIGAAPTSDAAAEAPGALDTSDPWNAPPCDGLRVLVIAASADEDWSFAAISGTDGKSQLRRRGGEVAGKKVWFVGWDRVWFESSGTLCQASVYGRKEAPRAPAVPKPAASTSAAPARGGKPLDPALKQGIQKVSATEFNIDRGVVEKILENQAELMRQARVVPEQENGRVVGIRMMGIRADSLLGELGMQNGDRLQTINGFDMASPEKALEAYARLRTADKLTVSINRGGKNMNLDYNIK